MSYGKPEGLDRRLCACSSGRHVDGRWAKKEAAKWMRLQYKKLGDDAPRKLRYRPHYC